MASYNLDQWMNADTRELYDVLNAAGRNQGTWEDFQQRLSQAPNDRVGRGRLWNSFATSRNTMAGTGANSGVFTLEGYTWEPPQVSPSPVDPAPTTPSPVNPTTPQTPVPQVSPLEPQPNPGASTPTAPTQSTGDTYQDWLAQYQSQMPTYTPPAPTAPAPTAPTAPAPQMPTAPTNSAPTYTPVQQRTYNYTPGQGDIYADEKVGTLNNAGARPGANIRDIYNIVRASNPTRGAASAAMDAERYAEDDALRANLLLAQENARIQSYNEEQAAEAEAGQDETGFDQDAYADYQQQMQQYQQQMQQYYQQQAQAQQQAMQQYQQQVQQWLQQMLQGQQPTTPAPTPPTQTPTTPAPTPPTTPPTTPQEPTTPTPTPETPTEPQTPTEPETPEEPEEPVWSNPFSGMDDQFQTLRDYFDYLQQQANGEDVGEFTPSTPEQEAFILVQDILGDNFEDWYYNYAEDPGAMGMAVQDRLMQVAREKGWSTRPYSRGYDKFNRLNGLVSDILQDTMNRNWSSIQNTAAEIEREQALRATQIAEQNKARELALNARRAQDWLDRLAAVAQAQDRNNALYHAAEAERARRAAELERLQAEIDARAQQGGIARQAQEAMNIIRSKMSQEQNFWNQTRALQNMYQQSNPNRRSGGGISLQDVARLVGRLF